MKQSTTPDTEDRMLHDTALLGAVISAVASGLYAATGSESLSRELGDSDRELTESEIELTLAMGVTRDLGEQS